MEQYVKFDPRVVALAEALMAAGLVYATHDSTMTKKSIAYITAAYLLYGSYLNTQGRIKLLKDDK